MVVIGIGLVVGVSYINAQFPNFYFQELEIIPDPIRPGEYTYIFNFYDNALAVEDPRIIISSDVEKKHLQLARVFYSDECFGAIEKIKANDPESIKAKLVSFEDKSQIDELEQKIESLKAKQERQKEELKDAMNAKYPTHQAYLDAVNNKADSLWKTEKELQRLTAMFYDMMSLYHPKEEKNE